MGQVLLGNIGVNGQLHLQVRFSCLLIFTQAHAALVGFHRITHHAQIQVKTNPGDMPRLLPAQQITGAANF